MRIEELWENTTIQGRQFEKDSSKDATQWKRWKEELVWFEIEWVNSKKVIQKR